MATFTIDRRALMKELESAEPILVAAAREQIKEEVFYPAVEELKEAFEDHKVTQEIEAGVGGENLSGTLDRSDFSRKGVKEEDKEDDTTANLWGFIGFDEGSDPLEEIRKRLDPDDPDGPKIVYKSKDKDNLSFNFEIRAPDESKIYSATPMPWAQGLSWAKRIEVGITGVGHFLNVIRKTSRSGGGIQVEGQIRSGGFKPVSYLTGLFKGFLADVKSR